MKPPFRVTEIQLKNYRGFRNFSLTFNSVLNISALVAENGNGKSSVLDILADILNCILQTSILNKPYVPTTNPSDILSGEPIGKGVIKFSTEYYVHDLSLLNLIDTIIKYVSENIFSDFDEDFFITINDNDENTAWLFMHKKMPNGDEIIQEIETSLELNKQRKKVFSDLDNNSGLGLIICKHEEGKWIPSLDIKALPKQEMVKKEQMELEISFELTPDRLVIKDTSFEYVYDFKTHKSNQHFITPNASTLLESIKQGKGSLFGYKTSNQYEKDFHILIYQGDLAINKDVKELTWIRKYSTENTYAQALEKDRFKLSDFINWLFSLWIEDKQNYEAITSILLDFLNIDGYKDRLYHSLSFDNGCLFVTKRFNNADISNDDGKISFEIQKFSTGELHFLGIIGELLIRSIPPIYTTLNESIEDRTNNIKIHIGAISGIVLIDELDMHLHPMWQVAICEKIRSLFPKVHFIVSTHSNYIIGNLPARDIHILTDFKSNSPRRSYGQKIDIISDEIMQTNVSIFDTQIKEIYNLISQKRISDAEEHIQRIRKEIQTVDFDSNSPELIKLSSIIDRIKILKK